MSAELRRPQAPATRPGSDRDGHVVAVRRRQALVVDPFPAFGEVTEVQRAAGRNRYRGAAGAVRAPPQRVGEGIPVIEVADYRHRAVRLIVGQRESNADGAVLPRPGCLDQLLSPVRRSTTVRAFDYRGTAGMVTGFNVMATRRVAPLRERACAGRVHEMWRSCGDTGFH